MKGICLLLNSGTICVQKQLYSTLPTNTNKKEGDIEINSMSPSSPFTGYCAGWLVVPGITTAEEAPQQENPAGNWYPVFTASATMS